MAIDIGATLAGGAGTGTMVIKTSLWIIIGLAVGGIIYLIQQAMSYNIRITIFKKTGGGWIKDKDTAKIKKDPKDKSILEHQLRKRKDSWDGPIENKYLIPTKKSFGMGYEVYMIEDNDGNLKCVMPPNDDYSEFHGITSADKKWSAINLKKTIDRYTQNSFWDQYGNTILNAALIGMVLVTMVVLVRELGVVTDQLGNVASALNNAASVNTQIISNSSNVIG